MRFAILVVQFVVALVVTASLMPVLLATVPAVRDPTAGASTAAGVLIVSFAVIAFVWPKNRRG
jgi:hypothetical protein